MRGKVGGRRNKPDLARIQQGRIAGAVQAAELRAGSHDMGWPHYDRHGNCLCLCRWCFGDAGCRCRGCSHASHRGQLPRFARQAVATALILLAAGLSLAAQPPARAATARHTRVTWGVNRGDETPFNAAIPGAHAVRTYYDTPNVFPSAWPVTAGPGVWQLISIRPTPWMLFHHRLDTRIRSLAQSAPPHSELTIWHENANGKPGCLVGPCNPLGYPKALRSPARFVRMQQYVERLVDGTRVRFGTIGCGPVASAPWWYAPGLDWYGFDMYWNAKYDTAAGRVSKTLVWARLSSNLAALKKASGQRYPMIRIGETNSGWDNKRRAWFADVASWFQSHDGNRPAWILTAWFAGKTGRQGGLSGPWPPSLPVIKELRILVAQGAP